MITIDEDKCTGCGLCVKICHESCLAITNNTLHINGELCSTCTQCIAVCAQQALSWDGVSPVAYDAERLPSPEQLDELFKERRSTRFFKKDKIDRTLLKEIIGYGIYAPTNNFSLKAVVVDDREVMKELNRIVMKYVSWIYKGFYRPKIIYDFLAG